MKLAINYSHPAANLVQAGEIKVDCFKTPDWDWMIDEARQIRPVAVHFPLDIGNGDLGMIDWQKIIRIGIMTDTPYVNFHLDSRGTSFPDIPVDSYDIADVQRVYDVIQADLRRTIKQFGAERIILENSPYRGEDGSTMRACIEPDLIKRLVDDTGCGLLLDISHAIITGKTIGLDPAEYMKRLPTARLKEMHFSGVHFNQISGSWMDHLSVQEEDWYWLDWVLERIRREEFPSPWLLAYEYGGVGEPFEWRTDPLVIAEQVPQIYERLHKITKKLDSS